MMILPRSRPELSKRSVGAVRWVLASLCLVWVGVACGGSEKSSDEADPDRPDGPGTSTSTGGKRDSGSAGGKRDSGSAGGSSGGLDAGGGTPGGEHAATGGADGAFPPAPNDLDPGDGTLSTGGSLVYNGTRIRTVASSTACGQQASTNRLEFAVSNFNKSNQVYTARITVPRDKLTASRVFEVGRHPEKHDFSGLDHASVRMLTPDDEQQWGIGGTIWVHLDEKRIPTVRAQAIPLGDAEYTTTGNAMSAALRCDEAVDL